MIVLLATLMFCAFMYDYKETLFVLKGSIIMFFIFELIRYILFRCGVIY